MNAERRNIIGGCARKQLEVDNQAIIDIAIDNWFLTRYYAVDEIVDLTDDELRDCANKFFGLYRNNIIDGELFFNNEAICKTLGNYDNSTIGRSINDLRVFKKTKVRYDPGVVNERITKTIIGYILWRANDGIDDWLKQLTGEMLDRYIDERKIEMEVDFYPGRTQLLQSEQFQEWLSKYL